MKLLVFLNDERIISSLGSPKKHYILDLEQTWFEVRSFWMVQEILGSVLEDEPKFGRFEIMEFSGVFKYQMENLPIF